MESVEQTRGDTGCLRLVGYDNASCRLKGGWNAIESQRVCEYDVDRRWLSRALQYNFEAQPDCISFLRKFPMVVESNVIADHRWISVG